MGYHPGFARHVVEAIRVAGLGHLVRVDYVDGWATRGSSTFDPEGVGQHHTAVSLKTTMESARRLIVEGRPDVPGPLANAHLSRKVKEAGGRYVLSFIAAGKSNHGGNGTWRGISGNSRWFGLETDNDGIGELWPEDQLLICAAFGAGCLSYLGKDVAWQWDHKEYATPVGRKPDRARLVGSIERQRTARILELLRNPPAPPPIIEPPEEDDMATILLIAGPGEGAGWWACFPGTRERLLVPSQAVLDVLERGEDSGAVVNLGQSDTWEVLNLFTEVLVEPSDGRLESAYFARGELRAMLANLGARLDALAAPSPPSG